MKKERLVEFFPGGKEDKLPLSAPEKVVEYRRVEVRTHLDLFEADVKAELYGLRCPASEDCARQEFKSDCDVVTVLSRHGYPPAVNALQFGEFDETVSLHSALEAVAEVRASYDRLDPAVRRVYPTLESLMTALRQGTFKVPEAPASGSGGASGTSEGSGGTAPGS